MMTRLNDLATPSNRYRTRKEPSRKKRQRFQRRRLLAENLEPRRLLAVDFGDAPDANDSVAAGDYQTTSANGGAAHEIVPGLFLGNLVDGDSGTAQGSGATADDHSTLLADLALDYSTEIDPETLNPGDPVSANASGSGLWQYLISESIDPDDAAANLQPMVWDTTLGALEAPGGDHADGFDGTLLGSPGSDTLLIHPKVASENQRVVARWVAGADDGGDISIAGDVRKSDTRTSDGIRLLIYVDSVVQFDQSIEGTDGRGLSFSLPTLSVAEGSTVDFVIDARGNSNFDSTRLNASITRENDEDGLVSGNLKDFDLLPGRNPEIKVRATNLTSQSAVVGGWIDFNQDGVFDNASERATAVVPAGTDDAEVTLVFPAPPSDAAFTTYARFRLSSDSAFVASPDPNGLVDSGEVEDYVVGRPERIWVGQGGDSNVFNGANWAIRNADGQVTPSSRAPRAYENVVVPASFAGETLLVETAGSDRLRMRSLRSAADLLVKDKGLIQINQDSQIAGLTLDGIRTAYGDSLESPNTGTRLIVDGNLVWNQAQINGLNIDVQGNLVIDTDREHGLLRSTINAFGDNSIWAAGNLGAHGSVLRNHGTLTTQSNGDSLSPPPFGSPATLINEEGGTWVHAGPVVSDDDANLFGRFYNRGTVDVRTGKLVVGDCCTRLTHTGNFVVRTGAQLTLNSVFVLGETASIHSEEDSVVIIASSNNRIAGTLKLDGSLVVSGGVTIEESATIPYLVMDGESITASQPLTVTEHFEFLKGTLGGGTITSENVLTMGSDGGTAGLTIRSTLVNEGQGDWLAQNVTLDGGTIQNQGSFLDASEGTIRVPFTRTGTIINSGTWTFAELEGTNSLLSRDALLFNRGNLDVGGAMVKFRGVDQESGELKLAGGTIDVINGLHLSGGELVGFGTVESDISQSGGVISPGMSPGQLNITGDLNVSDGEYLVQINGRPTDGNGQDAAGVHFDRLNVSGNATLDEIRVELLDGFQPTLSDRYLVLQAGGVSGPTTDNAADVGMTIPGSDAVVELLVTTLVNSPPVADAGGPYSGIEGTQLVLNATGSFSAKQPAETLSYEWDLDYDGITFNQKSSGDTLPVTFFDNFDAPRTIAVRVSDSDGDFDIASTTVSIANAAPEMHGAFGVPRMDVSIDDDYLATLDGQFVDPGHDSQTVEIDWGDGSPIETLSLSDLERNFSATHAYPVPEQATTYVIGVTVTDKDGASDSGQVGLVVQEPRSSIRGIKFDDANGNGTQDPDEAGLAGWTIELVDRLTGQIIEQSVTDSEGRYEFQDVAFGSYQVREVQQFGYFQTHPTDRIDRISVDANAAEVSGQSDSPSVSADGRFVAFSSLASNLVADDTNGWRDVFVKDTVTGGVERVSVSVTGAQADGASYSPAISGDGNEIVYRSTAQNLVQDDRNVASDIFAYDRRTGVTRRVSTNLDGDEGNEDSYAPSISRDGRFVAYGSTASNLVAGDTNRVADIFVTDLYTGLTERVSVASDGSEADLSSYQPSISDDGRYVAFASAAKTFDDSDRDANLDVYVYDRARDEIALVSQGFADQDANGDSFDPWISGDGTVVSFASAATNLFPGDTNGLIDVYVSDWLSGGIQRISHGNGPSGDAMLNQDGTKLVFVSYASDLVDDDINGGPDLFFYDRTLDVLAQMGQSASGAANHFVVAPAFSHDASTVVFASDSSELVDGDQNGRRDIFSQRLAGTYDIEIDAVEVADGLDFGNQFRMSSIAGQKFLDENGNGIRDVDPETGNFIEPGLDGWTIQIVNRRTNESMQTVTDSVDLDGDGRIDPISERGHYEFTAMPPGEYEVYELLEDGWVPTSPRLTFAPPLDFRAPVVNAPPPFGPSNDSRLVIPTDRQLRTDRVYTPVTTIPAVAEGQDEQLPILYVKGFNDDGASWAETGLYFQSLADVTGGQEYEKGSAGVETYGIQFWSTDDGDPNLDPENDEFDRSGAVVRSLQTLANPNNPLRKRSPDEFILDSLSEFFTGLFQPENWVFECPDAPDLTTCYIPALNLDFVESRSSYNENGLARYHAEDLLEMLEEQLGRAGHLANDSQINFITHSAGGLDTRAALALVQETGDPALQEAISNVVYTAPPFGGSTAGEMLNTFYENDQLLATIADPWVTEFLLDADQGPFEELARLLIAEPIAASVYQASNILSGTYDSLADQIAAVPTPEEVSIAIDRTIDDLDDFIKNITTNLPTGSFGIAEINDLLLDASNSYVQLIKHEIIDGIILPLVKQALTVAIGLPGQPKLRDDLRPYEAIHDNLERYDANLEIPQFVVWGEGGFLRYLTQMGGVDAPIPLPANSGPPLDLAASDPRSLHAYGNENRQGLDFSEIDIQPGDGNLSRTSALFLTDMAGGYMKALAGFSRHTHGSIPTDIFNTEDNIQGSFLDHDEDNTASLGEVIVETLLTPVTSLAITDQTVVVDADARIFRLNEAAEISFEPQDRTFRDAFSRDLHVYATEVEYRVASDGHIDAAQWQRVDPNQFSRRAVALASDLGLANEEPFTLQWRSLNQHGGREAIRTATFIIDTDAPSLQYVDVIDSESPGDDSQIYFAGRPRLTQSFQSRQIDSLGTFSKPIDWYINLDRGKQIHLEFDSPLTFEYAWNDPSLSSPRTSVQGDPSSGIVDLLVFRHEPGTIPPLGIGVSVLEEGTQVLFYRTRDENGNVSGIQSIEFFVDPDAPTQSLSAAENQIVGPQTAITYLAEDTGVGLEEAWVSLPGVGQLATDSSFSLSETTLAAQHESGESIELTAFAKDWVSNQAFSTFSLVYDYLAPSIEVRSVSVGTQLADGRLMTTVPEVAVVIQVNDDSAGLDLDSLSWSTGALSNQSLATGTLEPLGGGRFEMSVPLVVGENHLQISASDTVGNQGSAVFTFLRAPSHIVETERGDRVHGVDFGNTQFGSISGFTYVDVDEDLRYSGGVDEALGGVTVYADRNLNGVFDPGEPTVISDDAGRYRFENLPPRTYSLRVLNQAGYMLTSPPTGEQSIELNARDSIQNVSFGFEFLGATIAGLVFDDANANGSMDPGESVLEGFDVVLSVGNQTSNRDFTATSDADGVYAFTGLEQGDYTVLANGGSQHVVTTEIPRVVSIGDAEVDDKTLIGLFETASISGSVFNDLDQDGELDSGEETLSGFVIEVDYYKDGSVDEVLQTTSAGFSLAGLPAGQHIVSVVLPAGFSKTQLSRGGGFTVNIHSGRHVTGLDFGVADERGIVSGVKFEDLNSNGRQDPGESGLSGWTIYADLNDNETFDAAEPFVVTEPDGRYKLRLPEGVYVVREQQQPGWDQTFPNAVEYSSIADTDFVKGELQFGGEYLLWGEFTSPGGRLMRFDGAGIQEVVVVDDESIPSFGINDNGTVSWVLDPDGSDSDDQDEFEIYQDRLGTTTRLTRNFVEEASVIADGGNLVYSSGTNLLLNDGQRTILLSHWGYAPAADGGAVAFAAIRAEDNLRTIYHYDGIQRREIASARGEIIVDVDVHGSFTAWTQYDSSTDRLALWIDDGQTSQQLQTSSVSLTDIQIDQFGNVAFLRWDDQENAEVVYYEDGAIRNLTNNGGEKSSLSLDAGVVAWTASLDSTNQVSIWDGREILNPGFAFSYGAVVDEGRVAFFAAESVSLTSTEVYLADVRSYHAVSVLQGQTISDINFGNHARDSNLVGNVFKDLNGDGIQNSGEGGIKAATVELLSLPERNVVSTFQTTSDGDYEFVVPANREFIVRVVTRPGEEVTHPDNEIYIVNTDPFTTYNGLDFAVAPPAASDNDGVSAAIEDAAPNDGDGNDDGIADSQQSHVTSLPNAVDGTYVTIVAPEGTELVSVSATDENPDPENTPQSARFPVGFINFEIHGVDVGGTVDVHLILHNNTLLSNYYKYGPTPDNPKPRFYSFVKTSKHGIQSLAPGEIVVRFTDGMTGDDDLSDNGIIVDPGAPFMVGMGPARNPIDPTDVNNDGITSALDALLVLNQLARDANGANGSSSSSFAFLDVNGDQQTSAIDALFVLNKLARQSNSDAESEFVNSLSLDAIGEEDFNSPDSKFEETIALLANDQS